MITVNNVSLRFADVKLYDHVNLKFTAGNCYGIIGANGAGKSTFLKILSGELEPTSGTVSLEAHSRLATLSQDHFAFEDQTVLNTVMMGHRRLYEIGQEKDLLYMKEDFTDEDGIRAGELEAEFAELGGWEAEAEAASLLQGLGISDDLHEKYMSELIERDKVKVLLAQALFKTPDVLLLDEPTNGLDIQTIEWLCEFIIEYPNTVIVVSHDRYFLNKVCTYTCDVDFGRISLFAGNYDFWKQSSELAARLSAKHNAAKEDKIKDLQEFIARFSANASKSKQATSRKKILEKITLDDIKPSSRKYPFVSFVPEREIGHDLLHVQELSYALDGTKLFENVTFTLNRGDKVAFMSDNDLIISAFLDVLAGEREADKGNYRWGITTSRSYLPRDASSAFDDPEMSILDWLRQYAPEDQRDDTSIRGLLGRMLFSGDEVYKRLGVLSGGEKVRCLLSRQMLSKANVLLLDDPSNHLDLESISSLNDSLISFKGSVLFSSHDHEFIQTVANRIIFLSPHGMIDQVGMSYEDFNESESVQRKLAALRALGE